MLKFINISSLLGEFFYSQWNTCWPWFLVFFNYLHTMINILCHRGNLFLKLAWTLALSKSEIFLRPLFWKKSFNQTPNYCSMQFSRLNNFLFSIKIINHAMNHTQLNFGKIVHSIKETEKNCVGNRIDAIFFCKTTLFNSFEYVFLIFVHFFVCFSA